MITAATLLRQRWFALSVESEDGTMRIHIEPAAQPACCIPWLRFPVFAGHRAELFERELSRRLARHQFDRPTVRALAIHSREFTRALRAAGIPLDPAWFDVRREVLRPEFHPPVASRKAAAVARAKPARNT